MTLPKVSITGPDSLVIEGKGACFVSIEEVLGAKEILGPASALSLDKALDRFERNEGARPEDIYLTENDPVQLKTNAWRCPIQMGFSGDRITATAMTHLDEPYPIDTDAADVSYSRLAAPLVARFRGRFENIWTTDAEDGSTMIGVVVSLPSRRHTVSDVFDLGVQLQALLDAVDEHLSLSPNTALDLLKSGNPQALVGQPESNWLEAKRPPYQNHTKAQKLELAKDIAAFANSESPGLLAIGFVNRSGASGDVVGSLRPFRCEQMNLQSLRATIRSAIIPRLDHVDIGVHEIGGGFAYGWIFIPKQPPSRIPFLVRGAWTGIRVNTNFVSIPFRHGEDTVYADASAIHSLIAAGEASLSARRAE